MERAFSFQIKLGALNKTLILVTLLALMFSFLNLLQPSTSFATTLAQAAAGQYSTITPYTVLAGTATLAASTTTNFIVAGVGPVPAIPKVKAVVVVLKVVAATAGSNATVNYAYNALGLVNSLTDANSQTASFTYDAADRLVKNPS